MSTSHTNLTPRNFYNFAAVSFSIGMATVGFGAVDLAMVGALGTQHVAAVGQGELIATTVLFGFVGFVDVFATRLAGAEGQGQRGVRQFALATGFLCVVGLCALVAFALTTIILPVLTFLQQVPELVMPISDYVKHRLYGAAPFLIFMAAREALKICGFRSRAMAILIFGLVANVVLNAVFLFTDAEALFSSPEAAVAVATVSVHALMALIAVLSWLKAISPAEKAASPLVVAHILSDLAYLLRKGPGISARILNDYGGSLIPILLIGTLNTAVVAAAAVATTIFTLFCRVPQAVLSASFIYYSYGIEDRAACARSDATKPVVVSLMRYSAWPTLVALALTLVTLPWLVPFFGGADIDERLAHVLVFAYLAPLPFYFFEQFYAELLTAEGRSGLLFLSSTVATYLVTIPMAVIAVFVFESAVLAILAKGIAMVLLALVYWVKFNRWTTQPGSVQDA